MYESQVNQGSTSKTSSSNSKTDLESDWQRARIGIQLLLNNRISEAEALFGSRKDNVQMAAGYCFVTFMNALMTFEDEKLQESLQTLKDMEKRCVQDIGWLKAVRNRVFGQEQQTPEELASKLEEQIILADSQVCVALLTFLQHDLSGYVRGGWVLRKAWKVYQHTYGQILHLYQRACGNEHVPGSEFPAWQVVMKRDLSHGSFTGSLSGSDWSVPCSSNPSPAASVTPNGTTNGGFRGAFSSFLGSSEPSSPILEPDLASRLMCAVSFGYGIFQLCISLLPPSLLKLIHFLGFEGDRHLGVSALMFSRQGHDMRAPLATLALLWYHTIVRPFFALDGSNVRAGVEAAQQLLDESHTEFGQSALFLFFKGRVERLRSNIEAALEAYEAAVLASPQREVQLLCLHEVGWCHLIRLDWTHAYGCFIQLKVRSRWSNTFYTYLAAVCCGAEGDLDSAKRLCLEIKPSSGSNTSTSTNGGGSQLEFFIRRRTPAFLENRIDRDGCRLLAFEMLYLWNALPSCSQEHIESMQNECIQGNSEPMIGLRNLLNGAASICLGKTDSACHYFRSCLEQRHQISENPSIYGLNDHHIAAFALYELGVMLTKESQTLDEGIHLLNDAQTQPKGYDFENRLNVRIHAALRNAHQQR